MEFRTMATAAASVSRWARKFVLASVLFLVAWQAGAVVGIARRTAVVLGVHGFVLHMVLGKAYSLVPSYFDRQLSTTRPVPVTLALSVTGVVLLSVAAERTLPLAGKIGGAAWAMAVLLFVATLLWTVRDNLTGRETGTGEANEDRRAVDRVANAFVPLALAYLLAGAYGTLSLQFRGVDLVGGYPPRVSHLLAAGTAALLVFAIGFRLLPRFLVAPSPGRLVWLVLPAGAIGPAILAMSLNGGWPFRLGAVVESTAVLGFAATYATLYWRSDRSRVGFYGPLFGALAGSVAALFGLWFAFAGRTPAMVTAHFRLNVLGFLGLTIVGAAYQFYPPAVGSFVGASDRTALGSILCLGGGLLTEVVGLTTGVTGLVTAGRVVALGGALLYAGLIGGLFYDRYHQ
ncbi:MAG: hypothetical protein ABEH77_11240 [Halobacteriaceae archaeon]